MLHYIRYVYLNLSVDMREHCVTVKDVVIAKLADSSIYMFYYTYAEMCELTRLDNAYRMPTVLSAILADTSGYMLYYIRYVFYCKAVFIHVSHLL